MKDDSRKAGFGWALLMAWRDARRQKKRLALFALSVVFGVAALVSIQSFGDNLDQEVARQAKQLLGADLEFRGTKPFSEKAEALIAALNPIERSDEVRLSTMAYFSRSGATRLVSAQGMSGNYPWYGEIETTPRGLTVGNQREPVALVDESLALQVGLELGDEIKIGEVAFSLIGTIGKMPNRSAFSGTFAPSILIPGQYIEKTQLIAFGSRVRYRSYVKLSVAGEAAFAAQAQEMRSEFRKEGISIDTARTEQGSMQRTFNQVNDFLGLVALVALLLGSVGIAGAAQVYVKEKIGFIATLLCMGTPLRAAAGILCIQMGAVGLIGSLLGAAFGVGMQLQIPRIANALLPFSIEASISWSSVFSSLAVAWLFIVLFTALPLLPTRRATPLQAIRSSIKALPSRKDPLVLATYAAIGAASGIFCLLQSTSEWRGVFYFSCLMGALLLLLGAGMGLRALLRRLPIGRLSFSLRHGLANLYRPNNRTLFLTVTLGLGIFLIYALFLTQRNLLEQASFISGDDQPNVILFDIQRDQKQGVAQIMDSVGLPLEAQEPIVTMRLESINGRPRQAMLEDKSLDIEPWALRREYRSTYRDYLREDELVTEGTFEGSASMDENDPIPISIEERIVEALNLKIGDVVGWNVQGLPMESIVSSIRQVDWRRMRPNFFVVFPAGVLEDAPAFYITSTRAEERSESAALQSEVVKAYPNVSTIDLRTIIDSLSEVVDRIGFVIAFMSFFTIATGLIVLATSVISSRYQRSRESAMLRVLGASSRQIRAIMSVEYALTGLLASLSGIVLAVGAAWGLSRFVFEIGFVLPWGTTFLTAVGWSAITLLAGLLNSAGLASKAPLETIKG